MQNIKPILVPQYEELTADKMYERVKGYIENLIDYFPDYGNDYVPPRKYFWDIFSTLNQELAEKFIDHAIKERNKQKVTQESKIEISAEIMEQINKKHFYSRQKGRALSMLVSSREVYKVNRKRKREFKPYELSKEEMKNYKEKRSKPMNFNKDNEEVKLSKEEEVEEMEKIEREMNENNENDMNRDRDKY